MDTKPASIPRFWWLKRVTALVIITAIAWVAFHFWLHSHIAAGEAVLLSKWKADGGPHPDMLETMPGSAPNHPDNAAYSLQQAAVMLAPMTQAQSDWEGYQYNRSDAPLPLNEEDAAIIATIETMARPSLDLLRQARSRPEVDWGMPAVEIMSNLALFSPMRDVAIRAGFAAQLHHHRGEIAEAMRLLRDIQFLGEAIPAYAPSIISGLVGIGVEAMVTRHASGFALGRSPDLSPEAEDAAWREAAPEVRRLIAMLMDESADAHRLPHAFRGERTMLHSGSDYLATPGSGYSYNWLTAPFADSSINRMVSKLDDVADATASSEGATLPGLRDEIERRGIELDSGWPYESLAENAANVVGDLLMPSMERTMVVNYRVTADRRAAAVQLAARLYALDHDGNLPPTLEALVPDYLPFVPSDPFARDGAALRYRTDTPLPIVYSVGENFQDEGGSVLSSRSSRHQGRPAEANPLDKADLVYPLRQSPIEGVDPWNYLLDRGRLLLAEREEDHLDVEDQQGQPDDENAEENDPADESHQPAEQESPA